MRLLDAQAIVIHEFTPDKIPRYAILSHTWRDGEVSFQEMKDFSPEQLRGKPGYRKILACCNQALSLGIHYVWIDTCCIDKTSSAELSEAINSMFRWYVTASACFACLDDYSDGPTPSELIAPVQVTFFGYDWISLGTRESLSSIVSCITGIPEDMLHGRNFRMATIAARMSWAANRRTTRPEDMAYCLLGLFDVSMPLLYGEGEGAFIRLQEEIMKSSVDQSIFAWGMNPEYTGDYDDTACFPIPGGSKMNDWYIRRGTVSKPPPELHRRIFSLDPFAHS
ncbi:hypothetical protein NA57DRAFT_65911 [Rhizodiscina lignyota]|uniref:HET-domain-containing protein n=1 Tax=Rhizodiscina lignyota TaxID=1504668 RepID=A0A9P4M560_9PEZI|nr:hypothetical protein NA57DRAFT_65911 [Rhizodiscina lignyota]